MSNFAGLFSPCYITLATNPYLCTSFAQTKSVSRPVLERRLNRGRPRALIGLILRYVRLRPRPPDHPLKFHPLLHQCSPNPWLPLHNSSFPIHPSIVTHHRLWHTTIHNQPLTGNNLNNLAVPHLPACNRSASFVITPDQEKTLCQKLTTPSTPYTRPLPLLLTWVN